MPRNASGTYTAPVNSWNPPVTGSVIDPTDWIETQDDYVDALTDSLSRTGDGAMEADLEMGAFSSLYTERSAPSSPASNILAVYAKDNSTVTQLYAKDSAGLETNLFIPALKNSITFIIDGGGATITTGIKGDLTIPFACTITEATLLADQSGSIVVNVWKDTYANYPPTVADKITASAPPTISTATKSQDATLTGWTTTITAGDTLRFNVDSVTTVQRVTLSLKVTRTSL